MNLAFFTNTKMKEISVIDSNVKGYHNFRIRPHTDIGMVVEREVENTYDPYAMLVKMPELTKIPAELHNNVTRPAKGKDIEQVVKHIAGKTVGRVPANVCRLFYELLRDGDVKEIACWSV